MNNIELPLPKAVWAFCAGIGVYVVKVDSDRIEWRWSNERRLHSSSIGYDKTGRAYIRVNRIRCWLDEAVRI